MRKYFLLFLSFLLMGCLTMTSDTPKEQIELGNTEDEYIVRVLEMINYYLEINYINEANYLLSDLEGQTSQYYSSEISQLRSRINNIYTPDGENSFYNRDILSVAKNYNGKYGYIDASGTFIIEARYDEAEEFSEGLALVTIDEEKFFIDREGNIVLDEQPWEDLYYINPTEKTVLIWDDGIYTETPYDGSYELPFDETEIEFIGGFHNGLALCSFKTERVEVASYEYAYGRSGFIYINQNAEEVIFLPEEPSNFYEKTFYSAGSFHDGYAAVRYDFNDNSDRLYGYIDTNGNWLVEPEFVEAYDFQNSMACIRYPNTDKYGFIDTTGSLSIRPSYSTDGELYFYSDDIMTYYSNSGVFQYDKTGMEVMTAWNRSDDTEGSDYVDIMHRHQNGLTAFLVIRGDYPNNYHLVMYLDKKQNPAIVLSPQTEDLYDRFRQYEDLTSFSNGRAFVRLGSEYWGLIDLNGNFVVEPQKEWSFKQLFYNGIAQVEIDGDIAYINREGVIIHTE